MPVVVKDRIKQFGKAAQDAADLVLSAMSVDVMRMSKEQVPVSESGGHLQSSAIIEHPGKLQYRIVYDKVYARYQHEGGDDKRTIRNYTYPGKKSHFLSDPGNTVKNNQASYLKRMAKPL